MKIVFEQSGGFAPLPLLQAPVTLDTASLAPSERKQLESLVTDARFFDRPAVYNTAPPGAADYRTYVVTVDDAGRIHTIRLVEPIADPSLERLIDRLQDLAQSGRP